MNPREDSVTLNTVSRIVQLNPVDGFTIGPVIEEASMTGQIETKDSLIPAKKEALRQMVQDGESQLTEVQS